MAELDDLVAALDEQDSTSTVTSVRLSRSLRRALGIAVQMGWASNTDEALNMVLRDQLDAFASWAALDAHYAEHPEVRPDLADVAQALAELQHDPLADDPELVRQAAQQVVAVRPDADADDVLLWAAALRHQSAGTARRRRSA